MIQGKKKEELLSKEYILKKVSEYEIFRRVLGVDFKINESFCNPLRAESNESAIVREFSNEGMGRWGKKLVLKDYGDSSYNGDCFDLVQKENGCNFYEALELIEKQFDLKSGRIIISKKPEIVDSTPPQFQVITRSPTQEELKWWETYHQGLQDLKSENIYFPKEIWRNKKKIPITILTYCYFYPELQAWKLYRPHGRLGKKIYYQDRKWDSGIPNNLMENKGNIVNQKKAFIATSKKDKMVLRQALQINNIANIQSENLEAINDVDMLSIKETTEEQFICGDRDEAGKKFSWLLTKEFGFKHVNPPDDMPKDFADWGRDYNLPPIKEHFIKKGII